MKPISLLFLLLLLPAISFCQTILSPSVGSSDDPSTTIVKIETTPKYTVVVFKHKASAKGNWVQLNKSIYLQSANDENRYNYLRSEGIALRPQKDSATMDNQETNFTVYFEKLKPGTKAINIIERAVSTMDRINGVNYFNYYNVSLDKSDTTTNLRRKYIGLITPDKTSYSPFGSNPMASMGSMMNSVYTGLYEAQLKFYSDKSKVEEVAKINKSYYDALIKAGFTADQAFKILISKPLVSTDVGGK